MVLRRIADCLAFPAPPCSYSPGSHRELVFIRKPDSGDGPGIPCMLYIRPRGAPLLVVHSHSNASDIGDMHSALEEISKFSNVHMLSFEYPGYGLHVGQRTMQSIDNTVDAVIRFILDDLGVSPSQVVWYGRSIGSGSACRAAHRVCAQTGVTGGLIVHCGFADLKEVAGHLFGRAAKVLVPEYWHNKTLVAELSCPVLLIHGRPDKVVPFNQSEQLWEVVQRKEVSHFHACECGHNNFDFEHCVLEPIGKFLLSLTASVEAGIVLDRGMFQHAAVAHVGLLRSRIPSWRCNLPTLLELLAGTDGSMPSVKVGAKTTTNNAEFACKVEKEQKTKVPQFCSMSALDDPARALTDVSGMLRTCSQRMLCFFRRLQVKFSSVENISEKSFADVVKMAEAEYWACDPLLCLYEEIELYTWNQSCFRLGPFSIHSDGSRKYDEDFLNFSRESKAATVLRVPLWVVSPSVVDIHRLAETVLLCSEELQRQEALTQNKKTRSSCRAFCRRRARNAKMQQETHSPEDVAIMNAVNFVYTVHKDANVSSLFRRFVELYTRSEIVFEPFEFRSKVRSYLCYYAGVNRPGSSLAEFYGNLNSLTDLLHKEETQKREAIDSILLSSLQSVKEKLAEAPAVLTSKREADWISANVLRLYRGAEQIDPLNESFKSLALTLNDTMRAFAHFEQRERRTRLGVLRHNRRLQQGGDAENVENQDSITITESQADLEEKASINGQRPRKTRRRRPSSDSGTNGVIALESSNLACEEKMKASNLLAEGAAGEDLDGMKHAESTAFLYLGNLRGKPKGNPL